MKNLKNLDNYLSLINNDKPTVMFFTASWCPDCQHINSFYDKLIKSYDNFDFYTVDLDTQMEIFNKAGVMGIPSFVAYQDGRTIAEFIGDNSKTKEEIKSFLNKATAESKAEKNKN